MKFTFSASKIACISAISIFADFFGLANASTSHGDQNVANAHKSAEAGRFGFIRTIDSNGKFVEVPFIIPHKSEIAVILGSSAKAHVSLPNHSPQHAPSATNHQSIGSAKSATNRLPGLVKILLASGCIEFKAGGYLSLL